MNEPRWRTVLCWGAVIAYLTVPLITYALIVISIEVPWLHTNEHLQEFKGFAGWFQTLTALVVSLAGLNSWDKTVERKFNGGPKDGGRRNDVAASSDQGTTKPD